MTDAQIDRQTARTAARNCWLVRGVDSPAELMAEAKATNCFWTGEANMASLLDAEIRRIKGQTLGGHVSAQMRKCTA
jgi:hypothetical protein